MMRPIPLDHLQRAAESMLRSGWPAEAVDVLATVLLEYARDSGWDDLTAPALALRSGFRAAKGPRSLAV